MEISKGKVNPLFWKGKKVFLTGHTGFKGSWLSLWLQNMGALVKGYSLDVNNKPALFTKANIEKDMESEIGDIRNLEQLTQSMVNFGPEILIHMAAQPLVRLSYQEPVDTYSTNVIGTVNVLEAARKCLNLKAIISVTTDKCYENKEWEWGYRENDKLGGHDPYSASKVGTEIVVESYIKSFFKNSILKNRISTARAGNVIGGGDYSANRLIPDIISAINNKKKLKIRSPNHIRPWQHVLDPLMGYLILAKKQYIGKVDNKLHSWNFGPNINNFKKVIDIVKYIKNLERFEYILTKNDVNFKETEILKLNSLKAKKKLNWTSKWNLTKSIKKTLEWNENINNGISAKEMCERQFLMYINKD